MMRRTLIVVFSSSAELPIKEKQQGSLFSSTGFFYSVFIFLPSGRKLLQHLFVFRDICFFLSLSLGVSASYNTLLTSQTFQQLLWSNSSFWKCVLLQLDVTAQLGFSCWHWHAVLDVFPVSAFILQAGMWQRRSRG